jgi:hypothetical protein
MLPKLAIALTLATATAATAGPTVTVTPDAPFTEQELGEALELRGSADLDVRVSRTSDGRLVVTVGNQQTVIDPRDRDSRAAARVVAMVIVTLANDPRAVPPLDDEEPIPTISSEVRRPSPYAFRVVGSWMRDDSGYTTKTVAGSLAFQVAPQVRLAASVGLGTIANRSSESEAVVPLRLGIEGRAGALGIELGGVSTLHYNPCINGVDAPSGGYGVVRVYLPTAKRRVVIEGGGQYVIANSGSCDSEIALYQQYAGWLGAGVEW